MESVAKTLREKIEGQQVPWPGSEALLYAASLLAKRARELRERYFLAAGEPVRSGPSVREAPSRCTTEVPGSRPAPATP